MSIPTTSTCVRSRLPEKSIPAASATAAAIITTVSPITSQRKLCSLRWRSMTGSRAVWSNGVIMWVRRWNRGAVRESFPGKKRF